MKKGDRIRVLQMEDNNGMDIQAIRMNGNTYTVDFVDDAGQIHLQESGLALIPEVDKYIFIEQDVKYSAIQDYKNEVLEIYDIISDYIRFSDYIDKTDGLYLTIDSKVLLISQQLIPKGDGGTFFPIKTLVRKTMEGMMPNVDMIEDIVDRYMFVK